MDQRSRNVAIVTIPFRKSLDQKFLLTADRHWDNTLSNWELQQKHLQEAVAHRAGIFDFGDLFCAMQGKFDKRSDKDNLRSIHCQGDYLDSLVTTAADFMEFAAKRIIMLGMGNHETSILKKHETNLTNRLADELNVRKGTKIYNGGYSGWVIFRLHNLDTDDITTKKLWYIHGYGGGGPVTRGVIQTNRRSVYLPDADFVITGHTHDEWIVPIQRNRIDDDGYQYLEEQVHVQVPTYKDEYADGWGGFHIETGKPPKPIGAMWLQFVKTRSGQLEYHFSRAR